MNMTRRNVGDLSPPKHTTQKAPPGFQIAPATKVTTGIKSQLAALSSNQPGSKMRGTAINSHQTDPHAKDVNNPAGANVMPTF